MEKKKNTPVVVMGEEKKEKNVEEKNISKKREEHKKRCEKLADKIEVPINDHLQELMDSDRTFIENITRNAKKSMFSSFYPFPKGTGLLSTEKDEIVVLIVRHHWIGLLPKVILAFFTFILPFILSTTTGSWFDGIFSAMIFNSGIFIIFFMLTFTILLDTFYKWYFEMNVLTTSRIVDIDFVSIMTHRISETTYDQVQDVSHSPAGPLAAVFDYGDLYVQTAGSKNEFHFNNIPRPRDIQDAILDLRFLRRKKFIDMGK